MHGRLKVRTSAEEAERRKKEQELKTKAYRLGMATIFDKRKKHQLDEDMLTFTGQILNKNPDVYTLWNIRRECILELCSNKSSEKNQDLFNADLKFTEHCLKTNPKSYGAWHHRCWILQNSPNPNWDKEVIVCTKYLQLDDRNFHCWDYRRFVVEKSNVTKESELDFCTDKIRNNFSNYSSWHYRSKLLPALYPHKTNLNRPINEEKLSEELEIVLTAAFTDPNDSSAWFYQRWLLGYSEPELNICAFRINKDLAVISFTKFVDLSQFVITSELTDLQVGNWLPARADNSTDNTWILKGNFVLPESDDKFYIKCTEIGGTENISFEIQIQKHTDGYIGVKFPQFEYEFGSAVIEVLRNQLKSCQELLTYEPDSKWTLLTAALLMRAINRQENHVESIALLEKLSKIDIKRIGYYNDLASKWQIENKLQKLFQNTTKSIVVDLSGLGLTSIMYEQYLSIADEINLSNNRLTSRSMPKMNVFHFVKNLNLLGNPLTLIYDFKNLKYLRNVLLEEHETTL